MITAAEFLKWLKVFGVETGGTIAGVSSIGLIDDAGDPVSLTGAVSIDANEVPQETYTPTNFTPAAGTGFAVNSLTAMIKGLDEALSDSGGTPIAQLIWVNAANGNNANNGTINSPIQTYAAALAKAQLIATASNQVVLKMIGDFTIAGNLTIAPFVHIDGENSGTVTVTGQMLADSSFDSVANPACFINNLTLDVQSDIDLAFSVSQQAFISFVNVLTLNSGFSMTGSGATNGETLLIANAGTLANSCTLTAQDINLQLSSASIIGLNYVNSTVDKNYVATIADSSAGDVVLDASAGSTATVSINASVVGSLSLDGAGLSVIMDCASYSSTPSFAGGASIANITLRNLSDGMYQSTFVPSNYTPVGAAEYDAATVTGNFAGVDAALAALTPIPVAYGEMYFTGNSTETAIAAANTPIQINASAFNSGELANFTQSGGALTYTGTESITVFACVDLTATYNGSSQDTAFYIAKNGTVIPKSKQSTFIGGVTPATQPNPSQAIVDLVTNDVLTVWVENEANGDNIIVQDCNFIALPIASQTSGSISLTGENYLSLAGSVLDANPVNLATSNVTGKLPFANVQDIATSRVLGRTTASSGAIEELSIAGGLQMSFGTLSTTLVWGNFFGAISANANVTSPAQSNDAYYMTTGSGSTVNSLVTGTIVFTFTATSSTPSIRVTYPVVPGGGRAVNFVNITGTIYETGSPGIGNGAVLYATATGSGYFIVEMRVAATVGYTASISFQYQIQ